LAPTTKSLIAATARSATTFTSCPTGPSEPGEAPSRARISASVANRKGLSPGTFEAFTSFSMWSPRTSRITISGVSPSRSCMTTIDLIVFSIGSSRKVASSSHVWTPGVETFCIGWVGAPRGCVGASASASSTFAA
jgi:hypothetical protein